MPEGQLDSEGFLIDLDTLAWRCLLCPQDMQASLSPPLNPAITLLWWMRKRQGVYRNRGDKALCHDNTQLDRGRRMGASWASLEGGGLLINDSSFGPNTQLADLTKCSVSCPFVFSGLVQCLSSTYRRRRRRIRHKPDWAQGRSHCFQAHSHYLRLSIKRNETLLRR